MFLLFAESWILTIFLKSSNDTNTLLCHECMYIVITDVKNQCFFTCTQYHLFFLFPYQQPDEAINHFINRMKCRGEGRGGEGKGCYFSSKMYLVPSEHFKMILYFSKYTFHPFPENIYFLFKVVFKATWQPFDMRFTNKAKRFCFTVMASKFSLLYLSCSRLHTIPANANKNKPENLKILDTVMLKLFLFTKSILKQEALHYSASSC